MIIDTFLNNLIEISDNQKSLEQLINENDYDSINKLLYLFEPIGKPVNISIGLLKGLYPIKEHLVEYDYCLFKIKHYLIQQDLDYKGLLGWIKN